MATMTTVTLSPEQSAQLKAYVDEGRYASTDEAVEHLLSSVLEAEEIAAYSPEVLARLQKGFDEVKRGEFVSQEEVEALFQDWKNEPRK
jgi:Arc/MetJ-type ribon-helix-helix transcriptional regulator